MIYRSFFSVALLACFGVTLPVSAQTTLTLQPDSTAGKDAWIWSFQPARQINLGVTNGQNRGLHNVLRAEVWKWGGLATPDTIRALLQFDLSAIPRNAIVLEAKLSLYFYANPGFTPQIGENAMTIHPITETWEEGEVTWMHQPAFSEHEATYIPASTTPNQDYLDLDVRNLVQEMVYFPDANHGFMLRLQEERPYHGLTFASSDHADASKHPKLVIVYSAP